MPTRLTISSTYGDDVSAKELHAAREGCIESLSKLGEHSKLIFRVTFCFLCDKKYTVTWFMHQTDGGIVTYQCDGLRADFKAQDIADQAPMLLRWITEQTNLIMERLVSRVDEIKRINDAAREQGGE